VSGLKGELHRSLKATRQALLSRLEGLCEYDLRRPMTPTGTNLLGLVKHLASMEHIYLGSSFGHPPPVTLPPWDESEPNAEMWARARESSESVISLYQQACAHADRTIAELELDAPGSVAHWNQDQRDTTLGALLIWMVWETAQHAGHADIVRELIDGTAGADHDQILTAPAWQAHLAQVQAAANTFKPLTRSATSLPSGDSSPGSAPSGTEQQNGDQMSCAATSLPEIERSRLRALVRADVDAAGPLHADDYQLITPNGSEMTKTDYLCSIAAGHLRYQVFEPASDIAVLGDGPVAVLRYQARISFDDGPGFTCWHTDCYELREGRWLAVWSQATEISYSQTVPSGRVVTGGCLP
jgi:hypothetical protein